MVVRWSTKIVVAQMNSSVWGEKRVVPSLKHTILVLRTEKYRHREEELTLAVALRKEEQIEAQAAEHADWKLTL